MFARDRWEIHKGESLTTGGNGQAELVLSSGKKAIVKSNSTWPRRDPFEPVKRGWEIFVKTLTRQLQLTKSFKPGGGKGGLLPDGSWTSVAAESVRGSSEMIDVLVLVRGAFPNAVRTAGVGSTLVSSRRVAHSSDGVYELFHYRIKSAQPEVSLSCDKRPVLTWKVRDSRLPALIEADAFVPEDGDGRVAAYLGAGRPVSAALSVAGTMFRSDEAGKIDLAKTLNRIASRNGDFDIPELKPESSVDAT